MSTGRGADAWEHAVMATVDSRPVLLPCSAPGCTKLVPARFCAVHRPGYEERAHRVGGCNSWKVQPRNRGVGVHTQNGNGRLEFDVGRASVFFRFMALAVLVAPGGTGQARGRRRGQPGA